MQDWKNIPAEQMTRHASDDMLLFTAVLSVLIGVALTVIGHKGKQRWLVAWSIGLIICSIAMGIFLLI